MPPSTVHFVRHAQGFHNISVANHALHDPYLTPCGEEQCKILQQDFPFMSQIDCVVASPLKRTLYTALLSFNPTIQSKNLPVIALPELQETSDLPCDTGSDPSELEREFRGKPVDFRIIYTPQAKDWNSKTGKWAPTASAINDRARMVREWLYARPEKEIVVVTHGGFLHYLTQDWADTHKLDGTASAGKSHRHFHRRISDFSSTSPPNLSPSLLHTKPARDSNPRLHHHHHHIYDTEDPSSHLHKHKHEHLHRIHSYLIPGTGWANTEFRSYVFDTSKGGVSLIETPESRKRRLGNEKLLSKEEQKNLQRAKQQQWAEQEKQEKAYQKANSIQAKMRRMREDRDLGGYAYGF